MVKDSVRGVQYFTEEYLKTCKKFTKEEITRYLEDFRELHAEAGRARSKLISLRINEDLLEVFKMKCMREDEKYQSKIKELMKEYVME